MARKTAKNAQEILMADFQTLVLDAEKLDGVVLPGPLGVPGSLGRGVGGQDALGLEDLQHRQRPLHHVGHELARLAVSQAVTPARRTARHARIFAAFPPDANDDALARRIHHAEGAGLDGPVAMLAPLAARHAARHGAHREAARLYGLALRGCPSSDTGRRSALLGARARACALTGQFTEAIAVLDEAQSWATIAVGGKFAVTAETTSRFLLPVRVGRTYRVEARVADQGPEKIRTTGAVYDHKDRVCVESEATCTESHGLLRQWPDWITPWSIPMASRCRLHWLTSSVRGATK